MADRYRTALGPGSRAPPARGRTRGAAWTATTRQRDAPALTRLSPGVTTRVKTAETCANLLSRPLLSPGRIHARPARFLGRETSPLASHTRGIGGDRWLQQAEA